MYMITCSSGYWDGKTFSDWEGHAATYDTKAEAKAQVKRARKAGWYSHRLYIDEAFEDCCYA